MKTISQAARDEANAYLAGMEACGFVPSQETVDAILARHKARSGAFNKLNALPPDDPYWSNRWMFTRPVFTNESRQGLDAEKFWAWVDTQPTPLRNYIRPAPDALE